MRDRPLPPHPVKTSPFLASSSMIVEESQFDTNAQITNQDSAVLSSDLSSKLMGDVVVACGVTFGVAPFMAVIDKAIVQRAAGTHTILQSSAQSVMTMVRNPISYIKSPMFMMMWGVYAATYTTANCLKTIAEHHEHFSREETFAASTESKSSSSQAFSGGSKFAIFATTTVVNSSSTMLKDRFYAKNFGTSSVTSKVPLITYGLWGLRDCMVIGSSFILPEMICGALEERTDFDRASALRISQFVCPIATQTVAGPVQLLGLDIYNRPLSHMSWREMLRERFQFQCTNFTSIVGARIARIAPAYGLGGVCNTHFRDQWRESLLEV